MGRVSAELRRIDAVFAEQVVERRPRHPEELGCARQVSLCHRQRLPHRQCFGALAGDAHQLTPEEFKQR